MKHTIFSVVRYGNVMGSRGSVIPFFSSLNEDEPVPITDERMTRFMIPLNDAVELVWTAFDDARGGEIYVKKIPSMNINDIAQAIVPDRDRKVVGIRPGEKLHEQMIGVEDSPFTYEFSDYFKILPVINNWDNDPERIKSGTKVPDGFSYSSENNNEWMSVEELKIGFIRQKELIGKI